MTEGGVQHGCVQIRKYLTPRVTLGGAPNNELNISKEFILCMHDETHIRCVIMKIFAIVPRLLEDYKNTFIIAS